MGKRYFVVVQVTSDPAEANFDDIPLYFGLGIVGANLEKT